MSEVLFSDGSVYSSSQLSMAVDLAHEEITKPMVGVILAVNPSDDVDNLSAGVEASTQKGWKNECKVLIMDSGLEPTLLLENVTIPPGSHSGVDNFEEDLPRGVIRSLDGSKLAEHFKNQDISKLDAEWCVINFIGGSIDKPFITNWWHHPLNKHDPAASGQALKGNSLKQVDIQKNKFRKFRRINGVQLLISPEGDVYFDTSEANSKVDILPSVKRMGVKKGGNVQVNVKTTQQLEFNWNTVVEGLKAGSDSTTQSREESLPHLKAPNKPLGNPKARETKRTIVRFKSDEGTISTGKMVVYCHGKGEEDGSFMVTADDSITIGQGASEETLAYLSISEGELVLSTPDGDSITLSDDQVSATTNGGANIVLQGTSAYISAASGISLNGGTTPIPVALATPLITQLGLMLTALNTYLGLSGAAMDILASKAQGLSAEDKANVAKAGATAASAAGTAMSAAMITPGGPLYTAKLVGGK